MKDKPAKTSTPPKAKAKATAKTSPKSKSTAADKTPTVKKPTPKKKAPATNHKRAVEKEGPKTLYMILLGAPNRESRAFTPKDEKNLRNAIGQYFDGYSIFEGTGVWQNTAEKTFQIYIATTEGEKVQSVCRELRIHFGQWAIILATIASNINFVTEASMAAPQLPYPKRSRKRV